MSTFYDFLLETIDFRKFPTSSFDILYWNNINYNEVDYNWKVNNPQSGTQFTNPKSIYVKQNSNAIIIDIRYLLPTHPEPPLNFINTFYQILRRLRSLLKDHPKIQLLILVGNTSSNIPFKEVNQKTFELRNSNLQTDTSELKIDNQFWYQIFQKLKIHIKNLNQNPFAPLIGLYYGNVGMSFWEWTDTVYKSIIIKSSFVNEVNDQIVKLIYDIFIKAKGVKSPFNLLIYQSKSEIEKNSLDQKMMILYYRISALKSVLDFNLYLINENQTWNIKQLFLITITHFSKIFDQFPDEKSYHIINALMNIHSIWKTSNFSISISEVFKLYNLQIIQRGVGPNDDDFLFSIDFRNEFINVGGLINGFLLLLTKQKIIQNQNNWNNLFQIDNLVKLLVEDYLENATLSQIRFEFEEIGFSTSSNTEHELITLINNYVFKTYQTRYTINKYPPFSSDIGGKEKTYPNPPMKEMFDWFVNNIKKQIEKTFLPQIEIGKIIEIEKFYKENVKLGLNKITKYFTQRELKSGFYQRLIRIILKERRVNHQISIEKWKSRIYHDIISTLRGYNDSFQESFNRKSSINLLPFDDYFGYTHYGINDENSTTKPMNLEGNLLSFSEREIRKNSLKPEILGGVDFVNSNIYKQRKRVNNIIDFTKSIDLKYLNESIPLKPFDTYIDRNLPWSNFLINSDLFPKIIRIGLSKGLPKNVNIITIPEVKGQFGNFSSLTTFQNKIIEHNGSWDDLEEYFGFLFLKLFHTIPSKKNAPKFIKYEDYFTKNQFLYLNQNELLIICFTLTFSMIGKDDNIQNLLQFQNFKIETITKNLINLLSILSIEVVHRWSKIAVKIKRSFQKDWLNYFLFVLDELYGQRTFYKTGKKIISGIFQALQRTISTKLIDKDDKKILAWLKKFNLLKDDKKYSLSVEIDYLEFVTNNVYNDISGKKWNILNIQFDPWFKSKTKLFQEDQVYISGYNELNTLVENSKSKKGEHKRIITTLDTLTGNLNVHKQWDFSQLNIDQIRVYIEGEYHEKDDTIKWLQKLKYWFENENNIGGAMIHLTNTDISDWIVNVKDWMTNGIFFNYKLKNIPKPLKKRMNFYLELDESPNNLIIPSFRLIDFPFTTFNNTLYDNATYHVIQISYIGLGNITTRKELPKIPNLFYVGSSTTIYGFLTNEKTNIDPRKFSHYLLKNYSRLVGLNGYQKPSDYWRLIYKEPNSFQNELFKKDEMFIKLILEWFEKNLPQESEGFITNKLIQAIDSISKIEIESKFLGVSEFAEFEMIKLYSFDPLLGSYYLDDPQLNYQIWLISLINDIEYFKSKDIIILDSVWFKFFIKKYGGETLTFNLNFSPENRWVKIIYIEDEDLRFNFPKLIFQNLGLSIEIKIDTSISELFNNFNVEIYKSNVDLFKKGLINFYENSGLEGEISEQENPSRSQLQNLIDNAEDQTLMKRAIDIVNSGEYTADGETDAIDDKLTDLFRDVVDVRNERLDLEKKFQEASTTETKRKAKFDLKEFEKSFEIGNALLNLFLMEWEGVYMPSFGFFDNDDPYDTVFAILMRNKKLVEPRMIIDFLQKEKSLRRSIDRAIPPLSLYFNGQTVNILPDQWKRNYFNLSTLGKITSDEILKNQLVSFIQSILIFTNNDLFNNIVLPPKPISIESLLENLKIDKTLKSELLKQTQKIQTFNEFGDEMSKLFQINIKIITIRLKDPTKRIIEKNHEEKQYGLLNKQTINLLKYVKVKKSGRMISTRVHYELLI